MIKIVLLSLAGCLVVLGACYGAYKQGKQRGMEDFHEACFLVGGYAINKHGQVIACKGQGVIPKEELHNFTTL